MSTGRFYNNVSPEDIVLGAKGSGRLGIHHMAQRGIAGRGVLLDYGRWCERNGKQVNPLSRHVITVDELEQVAKDQKVEFQEGDILLLRTGWMAAYEREGDRLNEIMDLAKPECIGVEACQDTYRWVWNNRFAAVAGDHVAFEAFPPKDWNDSCRKCQCSGLYAVIGLD